ncbi:MAG: sulfite exporter TauE/SafE family protein [Victivallaceae bacterium]|nr:sulfite exporter TauE/SafE family protein [Victivallaceae bacterium]
MDITIILLIVAMAGFVQGGVGFGFGLIAISLLSLVVNIKDASIMLVLAGLCLNIFIFIRLRRKFKFEKILPITISALPGVPLGTLLLLNTDATLLRNILGIILVIVVIQRMIYGLNVKRWHPYWLGVPCGLFSGVLAGAFGTGGPLVVAYIGSHNFEKFRYSASIQFILGSCAVIRLIFLGAIGSFSQEMFIVGTAGMLAAVSGAYIGLKVMNKIPGKQLQRIITALLLILGIKYIFF